MRRGSFTMGQTGGPSEPLIVVEESGGIAEEDEEDLSDTESPTQDSPLLNPYLLSPYRDMRKRSLPTMQCTAGITASQVRRLSEQGGESGKGPSPIEAAFLATLSQAPAPTPGGRRHSIVTISKAPKASVIFGRNRRESFAAFPSAGMPPLGPGFPRKDSSSSLARTPSLTGSSFNLQLDIMDDIAEIKAAKKVKLKMWQTDNQEQVCEVQPLDGSSTSRYHQKDRRFSDVSGINMAHPQPKRRASELPLSSSVSPRKKEGIVCSNSDIINIMSSLTSSAQEIRSDIKPDTPTQKPSTLDQKRGLLKNSRSNSFDISLLPECKTGESSVKSPTPANWFTRRHLPIANKKGIEKSDVESADSNQEKIALMVTLNDEEATVTTLSEKKPSKEKPQQEKESNEVLWDKPSGSVVDAHLLGSAIEEFLTQKGGEPTSTQPTADTSGAKNAKGANSWFGGKNKQEEEEVTCDNSICSTLKDLFVK